MNKEQLKTAALCAAAAILIWSAFNIHNLRQELESCLFKAGQIQHDLEGLQDDIRSQKSQIESILKEHASILLEQSVDYQLKGDKIQVTVFAVPKELAADETVAAKVIAGDAEYEAELDENGRAALLVEPDDMLKTIIQIRSENGVRQQILEERQTGAILACKTNSEWLDDSNAAPGSRGLLNVWVTGPEFGLPFTKEDVAKAEFIVVNSGMYENGGEFGASSVETIDYGTIMDFLESMQGYKIPAQILNASDDAMLFRGDFAEYIDLEDGIRYDVAFILETRDGLIYTMQDNYIASLSSSETSRHRSSGNGTLIPVF